MPKRGKKIAHQPGYELEKNPETGARRWHAVKKKRPNPETGKLVEEPALFEELPDATESDAAVEWLKARGIAFYPGGGFDLPDPSDFLDTVEREGRDPSEALGFVFEGLKTKGAFRGVPPPALVEWLGEVIEEGEGVWEGSLDEEDAKEMLDAALSKVRRGELGALGPVAAVAVSSLDQEKLIDWIHDRWMEGDIPVDSLAQAVESVVSDFSGAGQYSDAAENVLSELEEWLDEGLDQHDLLVNADSYHDRASIMEEQRTRVLPTVVKIAGVGPEDKPDSIDALADDATFARFLDNLVNDHLGGWDRLWRDGYHTSVHDKIWLKYGELDEDRRRMVRERFVNFVKKAHQRPAISTNRTPGAAAHLLRDGEYTWRGAEGADDLRVKNEDRAGLGRVVYGAYAHEDAVPFVATDDAHIGAAIRQDPDAINLGTNGWGQTRLLWVPKELTEGGTSFAFNDVWYEEDYDQYDLNFENSAILAALAHAMRSTVFPADVKLERYKPAFTEVHLYRPLQVEGDLKAVFTPLTDGGLFPWQRFRHDGVDGIMDAVRNYRYSDLASATTMAREVPPGVSVHLVAPWLDAKPLMGYDPTGQATQDLIGGIQETLEKDWGDKMKLWVPKSLREE